MVNAHPSGRWSAAAFPRAHYWDQPCLISILAIWMKGLPGFILEELYTNSGRIKELDPGALIFDISCSEAEWKPAKVSGNSESFG